MNITNKYPESEERQLQVGDKVILVSHGEKHEVCKVVRVTKTMAVLNNNLRFKNTPLKRYGFGENDSPNGVTHFRNYDGYVWYEVLLDTPYSREKMRVCNEKREVEKFINILQSERFDMEKKRKIYNALKDLELWAD